MKDSFEQFAANSPDYQPVSIFFEDETIKEIFSQLLEVRGVHTRMLTSPVEFAGTTRIITEPRYFSMVGASPNVRCLLVGNKESLKGLSAVPLARPLTEEKIEEALSAFLGTES